MQTSNVHNERTGDRSTSTVTMCVSYDSFFFFFAKSWNFCDINRRSMRPDKSVTGVKIFLYVARRALQSVQCYICTARPTIYSSFRCSQYSVYEQRGNFVTVHCVRLITTPLKYTTLYFNIQRRSIWKSAFYEIQMSTLPCRLMVL